MSEIASLQKKHSYIVAGILLLFLLLYFVLGFSNIISTEKIHQFRNNPWTPVIIILSMTIAWVYALPGSIFFFVVLPLYPPISAVIIIVSGSILGSAAGYITARYIGSPWSEKFRSHKITKFLTKHSSFSTLLALRVAPSSPHGFINYGAGLARIPFLRFIISTALGLGIKAWIYAYTFANTLGAKSLEDAISWKTSVLFLSIMALGFFGHWFQQRWEKRGEL